MLKNILSSLMSPPAALYELRTFDFAYLLVPAIVSIILILNV